jgi:hypothetical protein
MSYEAWGEPDGRPHPAPLTTRCLPSRECVQSGTCARFRAARAVTTVDASICLRAGAPCPMFIDRRGLALRAAPAEILQ